MDGNLLPNTPSKRTSDQMTEADEVLAARAKMLRNCQKPCIECKKLATNNGGDNDNFVMICHRCNDIYHSKCAGIQSCFIISEIKKQRFKWSCYKCQILLLDSVAQMSTQMQSMNKALQNVTQQFTELAKLTASYENAVSNLNARLEVGEKNISNMQEEIITLRNQQASNDEVLDLKAIIEQMKGEIVDLKARMISTSTPANNNLQICNQVNYLSNLQRKDDLVIQEVPTLPNESETLLRETVIKLANSCGCVVQPNDLRTVHRMKRKKDSTTAPPILVKFNSTTAAKESFFVKYLKTLADGHSLTRSCIGLEPPDKRIYVNHHISPELMNVKKKALDLKKENFVQRVTTRYNTIRLQKDEIWHNISTLQQLDSFLKQHRSIT